MVKHTKRNRPPIEVTTESYRKFIFNSNVIIDKSLFIKEILEHHEKRVIIVCPPKWSKTMILGMLKTFLQIEHNPMGNPILPMNKTFVYKFFKYGQAFHDGKTESFQRPFLISQHQDIIDQHLGQYPVIHVSFNDLHGVNDTEAKQSIKTILRQAYAPHKHLLQALFNIYRNVPKNETIKKRKAKAAYQRFMNISEGRATDEDTITKSLDTLCKLLYRRYNKRVVVVIDDYDLPFYKLLFGKRFPESDIKRILSYIEKILKPIIVETNQFVERVIITATYRIVDVLQSTLKTIPDYTLVNNPWMEFFGINEHEQQQLCQEVGKTDKQCRKASEWYLGYKANVDNDMTLGPPFSTAMCLDTNLKKGKIHLTRKIHYDYISRFIKMKPFWEAFESLINGNKLTIKSNDLRFTVSNMYKIKHLAVLPRVVTYYDIDLVLSFLCASGYLTFSKPNVTAETAQVWIPNVEMTSEIGRTLKSHYTQYYGISFLLVDKLVGNIGGYVMSTIEKEPEYEALILEQLFTEVKPYDKSNNSTISITEYYQDMMHALLSFISMKLHSLMYFETLTWKEWDPVASYMIGTRENNGVIIAVQYNTTAEQLLVLAKKHRNYLLDCDVRKFFAIVLHPNNTANMISDADSENEIISS